MNALTSEDVVSGVAINVRAAFNTSELKAIYKNLPQQNTVKPYAFIHQINAEHKNEMRGRANWSFIVDVRVHPQDGQVDVESWSRSIALRLIECINTITISGYPVKAKSIEYRVEDGVLHCIAKYSYKVVEAKEPGVDMRTLHYGDRVKI